MATVYILHSLKLDRFYIGSCLNLEERLNDHKGKKISDAYTAKADDWSLFFSIVDLEYTQARQIELHIKRMKSKKYTKDLKLHREIVDKLIERYR